MGRSDILDSNLSAPDDFFKRIAPYYDAIDKLEDIPEQYRNLDNEQKLKSSLLSFNFPNIALPKIYEDDSIYIDINDWKIQHYWYKDFCNMVELFQKFGLRGDIELEEEESQYYVIQFRDNGVFVKIHGPPEWEDIPDDAPDDWWDDREPLVYSKQQPYERYVIHDGGLHDV